MEFLQLIYFPHWIQFRIDLVYNAPLVTSGDNCRTLEDARIQMGISLTLHDVCTLKGLKMNIIWRHATNF